MNMMRSVVFLLLIVALVGVVTAQEAVIKAVPHVQGCWAPGESVDIDVWVSNEELDESTDGVQWALMVPDEIQPYVTITDFWGNKGNPPVNDFFEGKGMFVEVVNNVIEDLQLRLPNLGESVLRNSGNVATYTFKLSNNFRTGGFNSLVFDFEDVKLCTPDDISCAQPYRIEYEPFNVCGSLKKNNFWQKILPLKVERTRG